jgi:carbon monoxide dehydrogenase subunit G
MSINVPFDLSHEFEVKAGAAEVFALLADVPASASHFPKVDKLVHLGGNRYRWELERVGTEHIHIQTVYAAAYVADRKKLSVRWSPVQGVGNAQIGGSWTLTAKKHSTHIVLQVQGEITVPLPGLMHRLVEPVVTAENEKLIHGYIANLCQHLGGEVRAGR